MTGRCWRFEHHHTNSTLSPKVKQRQPFTWCLLSSQLTLNLPQSFLAAGKASIDPSEIVKEKVIFSWGRRAANRRRSSSGPRVGPSLTRDVWGESGCDDTRQSCFFVYLPALNIWGLLSGWRLLPEILITSASSGVFFSFLFVLSQYHAPWLLFFCGAQRTLWDPRLQVAHWHIDYVLNDAFRMRRSITSPSVFNLKPELSIGCKRYMYLSQHLFLNRSKDTVLVRLSRWRSSILWSAMFFFHVHRHMQQPLTFTLSLFNTTTD